MQTPLQPTFVPPPNKTTIRAEADPVLRRLVQPAAVLEEHSKNNAHTSSIEFSHLDLMDVNWDRELLVPIAGPNKVHPSERFDPIIKILTKENAVEFEQVVRGSTNSVIIYTDASKFGNSISPVGSAAVRCLDTGDNYEVVWTGNLEPGYSVYDGEIQAIERAVDFIKDKSPMNNRNFILSDSLSSILAIQNADKSKSSIVHRIISKLKCLDSGKVVVELCWIPAHTNIPGNEIADVYAKDSVDQEKADEIIEYSPDLMFFSTAVAKQMKARWQKSWILADTGRTLFDQCNVKSVSSTGIHPNSIISLLLR